MSTEEHEEIPWSMLVEHDRRSRSRMLYIAAAVIVALVVIVAAVRWVDGHRHGIDPAETVIPVVTTTIPPAPPTTLVSEADLMAVDSSIDHLAAIARAEWFVTDYFTIDGAAVPEFLAAFPDDAVLPELPQSSGEPAVSFVEWARATALATHGDGYVVTVLFRTLYENTEQRFERSPVRAVDVIVIVDGQRTAVADLPIPVEAPVAHGLSGWPQPSGDATEAAIASALEYAGVFTENPALIDSGGSGTEWRVVFSVDDPSGATFPMVLRSDVSP